jgi:enoyl-CoA hydratase/carnithine racemase
VDTNERTTIETRGHVLLVGLNRIDKRNAFDLPMIRELSLALTRLTEDPELRCAVIHGHGPSFCSGLDLMAVAPIMLSDNPGAIFPSNGIDPWGVQGPRATKPVVTAIHGHCYTAGIELALAGDVIVAAEDTRIAQQEVSRGIIPLGGGTWRWPESVGWGNAMRYMLTGDEIDAAEALRIGLVQEVVANDRLLDRAIEMAERISAQAPLAVQAALRNARLGRDEGAQAAAARVLPELMQLVRTEDAAEGIASLAEKRVARFKGR